MLCKSPIFGIFNIKRHNVCLFVQERGQKIEQKMRDLETGKLAEMEKYLTEGIEDSTLLVHLFTDTATEELDIYSTET